MVRGSTPTFTILLPTDVSNLSSILVTFVQNGKHKMSFGFDRIVSSGKEISFELTEEETLTFSCDGAAEMQIRLETREGAVLISDIRRIPIRKKYPNDLE